MPKIKNSARGHKVERHHLSGRGKRPTAIVIVLYIHTYEEKTVMAQKYSEKATSPKKKKNIRHTTVFSIEFNSHNRYFQHDVHFIPLLVDEGKRGAYELVHGDLPREHPVREVP